MNRADELSANLAQVHQRIGAACISAGRPRDDVSLIVVTKTYPASDVIALASLGVTDVGENRHPEAGDKHDEAAGDLTWHFVGGLQTNKASAVARYADFVHSVDRTKLVGALDKGARAAGRTVGCFVQVALSDESGRSGVTPDAVLDIAGAIASATSLSLAGVMAVAPLGGDPDAAFAELREISTSLIAHHEEATKISAGMSGDLESAVKFGATHLRVGRSVLGERPPTR